MPNASFASHWIPVSLYSIGQLFPGIYKYIPPGSREEMPKISHVTRRTNTTRLGVTSFRSFLLRLLKYDKRKEGGEGSRFESSLHKNHQARDWFQGSEPPRWPRYLLNNRFSYHPGRIVSSRGHDENRWRIGRHKSLSVWHTRYTGLYVGPMGPTIFSISLVPQPLP